MTKFKRPVPDVTPTSSFSKLTKFLIYSFQKDDRKLVRDILVQRENCLKDQLHKVQQERDVMEKSCEELKRERDLCRSKLSWAEMDRERLQEKMRRGVEVMEERENNLRMELESSRESYEALEGENRVLHQKNEECSEKLKMVQEILVKREKELGDEAEKREHLVKLRKVEELEAENREQRNKIEISSETLGKEFAIFEERFAKMKGAFGSVCSGNAETDRASGNGAHGMVVSITDSHHKGSNLVSRPTKSPASSRDPSSKTPQVEGRGSEGITIAAHLEVKTESSFLEYEADDGSRSENNINCKRKRSIDETEGGKDSTAVLGFQSGKEIRWKHKADMLSAFKNTPELCMAAVCALYRQTISAMVSKEGGGFSSFDIVRGTAAAKYLINSDPEYKLTRSVLEVQQNKPTVFEICQRMAFQYDEQLFRIYQKELDPFFFPKS